MSNPTINELKKRFWMVVPAPKDATTNQYFEDEGHALVVLRTRTEATGEPHYLLVTSSVAYIPNKVEIKETS